MKAERAVLVFCEGSHDVIFVQRVLGQLAGFEYFEGVGCPVAHAARVSAGRRLARLYFGTELKDRSESKVRSLNSPEEPVFESVLRREHEGDTIYVLLKRGHNGFSSKDRSVVDDLRRFEGRRGSAIQAWAVAILTDADDVGLEGRAKQLTKALHDWPGGPDDLKHGAWTQSPTGPIGLFVFSRPHDGKGTLDDHLAEIIRQDLAMPFAAAERFIDDHKKDNDRVSKRPADRLKGAITVAGQLSVPGAPLSEVISRNGPLQSAAFGTDLGKELVEFLLSVTWSLP